MEGLDLTIALGLFIEGGLSFLSPCILPLVPLYISYISQTSVNNENNKTKTMIATIFFVLGISSVFFIMGLSANVFKKFFVDYQVYISIVGGIILIIFGLINLNVFKKLSFNKSIKFEPKLFKKKTYLNAYLLGFFFSFGWSPCIGPYLAQAFLLASSASFMVGNMYILLYGLGFVIPFLLLGIFTDIGLKLIKNNMHIMNIVVKIGAIIMIVMGCIVTYDSYVEIKALEQIEKKDPDAIYLYDFELEDQFGNISSSEDLKDDYVIVEFVASWCKYCSLTYPYLQELKDEGYQVIVISSSQAYTGESMSKEELTTHFIDKDVSLPILLDMDMSQMYYYGIQSFPTTAIFDKEHKIIGAQSGVLSKEILVNFIESLD